MNYRTRGRPDFILLFLTCIIVGFGLVMMFSASSAVSILKHGNPLHFVHKQMAFAGAGIFFMCVLMNIPISLLKRLAPLFLLGTIVVLVLVLFIGVEVKGAKRWLEFGGFGFQPAEFIKLFVIIFLAAFIQKKAEKIREFKTGLLPIILIMGIVVLLILKQPDFGTALIIVLVSGILVLSGGAKLQHLLIIVMGLVPIFMYLVFFESYRLRRITAFINPWEDYSENGYQLIQSLYAFAHGGITGAGLGQSIQKLHYLPEAHTDFIFAVIAEELGFFGICCFLIVYFLLIFRGFVISLKCEDSFGMLLGIAITGMIAIQSLFNVGAVSGALPITGVTLPFISYGGSSLLISLSSMGILLSISRQNNARSLSNEDKRQLRA